MDQSILEPIKSYFEQYRDSHRQLAEQYFDGLVNESGVSAEENAALMSERNKALAKFNVADAKVRKLRALRAVSIVVAVLAVLAGIITCVALWDVKRWVGLLVLALCAVTAVAMILCVCLVLNKRIKSGGEVADKFKKQADDIEARAWKQMQPLNSKYDWNIPAALIYQTVPQIQLDKYFDEDKLAYFDKRCRLGAYDEDSSALCVKSGNSDGRPFLYIRFLRQSMVPRTYTGTRVVTWTEWETDSQGHRHSVTCSETLVATVVKPCPVYTPVTYLFFGCDAATELHFSRQPVVPKNADEKDVERLVKKGEKALERKARKAVEDGGTYNKFANSEFEVLFGADNRDNELQFRLMFTPLAQQNMVHLLTSREAYGDDFCFDKDGAVNVIRSEHSARLEIDANPTRFVDFDMARARKNFVEFNCEYFRSLYFDFAPLFSVPLYTQEPPVNRFAECTRIGNIGSWEAEAVANHFDANRLAHPDTATDVILKATTTVGKDVTTAHITAHSFEAVPQIEYVPKWCRNGDTYEVPVPWTLYIPLQQTTDVEMQAIELTREQFNRSEMQNDLFVNGIRARINKN